MKSLKIKISSVFLLLVVFYLLVSIIVPDHFHSIKERILYGLPFIIGSFTGIIWFLSLKRLRLSKLTKIFVITTGSIFLVGILTTSVSRLFFNISYPIYIFGDAASILWLCFAIAIFGNIKNEKEINFKKIYKLYEGIHKVSVYD